MDLFEKQFVGYTDKNNFGHTDWDKNVFKDNSVLILPTIWENDKPILNYEKWLITIKKIT